MDPKRYKNFQVETDTRGVTTVTLDVPNRPLNVLDRQVMTELEQIVTVLENSQGVRLVVLNSGKESGFLAGADVHAIADIQSDEQAGELIDGGQELFSRIEALPMPTVVVIHGPCLGGGFELALACNYRIARNNSSTKIGLPEIKLGVIPGWGGTQRLPRLAGMSTALRMILKGQFLNASEALRVGVVDQAIDPERWQSAVESVIEDLLAGERIVQEPRRLPFWKWMMERTRLGQVLLFRSVRKSVASKSVCYPALNAAIDAVRMSNGPKQAGFRYERETFIRLLATDTSRHLLQLFFARESARAIKTWSSDRQAAHDMPIRKVGVVGAGAMGAGIGQLAAFCGFDVAMKEVDAEAAEAGRQRVKKLFDDLAKRKGWDDAKRNQYLQKVTISRDDALLEDADLVIEAVVEREDVKSQVFKTLDRVVKKKAILASNTSSLSVSKMAAATQRRGTVAGLHFFNPVHRMELVEVVRAAETDEATIARLVTFVRALGKTPVVTADSPGFLVNRVLFPYLGEAVLLVNEAHDVGTIDRDIRRFGMPMGPLELLDQVGIDVAHHVAGSLEGILPGVARVVDRFAAMVDQGHLGKKSGRGFYHYHNGKRGKPAALPLESSSRSKMSNDDFLDDEFTAIQRRLIYPMLSEAIRCHQEGVVKQPWAIDLAMVLGTGFAPHRGGPLHVVDSIGLQVVLSNLRRMRSLFGSRFEPPKQLVEMANRGETFFQSSEDDLSNQSSCSETNAPETES